MCVFMEAHTELQVCLALQRFKWDTETCDSPLRFPKWVLEEHWKVTARSAVSHGADGGPLGSVVQSWDSLLLCHRCIKSCQGQAF